MSEIILPNNVNAIAIVDGIEAVHPARSVLELIERRHGVAPTRMAINKNCLTTFTAKRNSGRRPLEEIWWHVIHDTEGDTARAAAAWFENPRSKGSAHSVSDDNECYMTLADDMIPWGAPGANYHGLHYEQAGHANWATVVWSEKHRLTLQRTAYRVAVRVVKYNTPVQFCTAAMLRAGVKGITTHAECTKAFGGDHTDPGAFWPRRLFMSYVRGYVTDIRGT